VAVKNYHPVGL